MSHADFPALVAQYRLDRAEALRHGGARQPAQVREGDARLVLKVFEPEIPRLLVRNKCLAERGAQRLADSLEGGPRGGLGRPAAGHQGGEGGRHVVAGLHHGADAADDVLGEDSVVGVLGEGELPGHELVEDDAEGVDVDRLVEGLVVHDLGRHVPGRPLETLLVAE